MFVLRVKIGWEAAHRLSDHDGRCRRLHGHSYRCTLILESEGLINGGPKDGMVVDYADVKAAAQPMLERYLDHHYLNETLGDDQTTVERLCAWVYYFLKRLLPQLAAVRIDETCTGAAEYRP